MKLSDLAPSFTDTVTSHYKQNRLLLVHPRSQFRNLQIASLLNEAPCPIYYYGLGIGDSTVSNFISNLFRALSDENTAFSNDVDLSLAETPDLLPDLAGRLANKLNDLHSEDYILVLDDFDWADEVPEIQTFVEILLENMPPQCHLLISSRTMPRMPWTSLVARGEALVIRDNKALSGDEYSANPNEMPNVEVFAFGPGLVMINGQIITSWDGHIPKLLFFFVLDRKLVTRDEICATFWPDLAGQQVVNVFHVTKRRLHKALEFDALTHDGGYYRINPQFNIQYDVHSYVDNLVAARNASGSEANANWHQAIESYRGPYLQGYDNAWVVSRRNDFREGYVEALTELGNLRGIDGDYKAALAFYRRAVNEAYMREDIHRSILLCYDKLGRRSEAAAHYQDFVAYLNKTLKIRPSPETRVVYDKIIGA